MIQHLIAAALLLGQTTTGPAEPARPCITHEEAGDIAVSLLPFLIDAAAQRCRPHLAAEAFLLTGAADWSARLRRDSAPRRASALRGISKMGSATPPTGAGGDAAFDFVAQLVTGGLTGSIQPESCPQVDAIAQSLSPLPTDNIARLVGAGVALAMMKQDENETGEQADEDRDPEDAGRSEGGDGPPICRA